jgi:hypothetical protein
LLTCLTAAACAAIAPASASAYRENFCWGVPLNSGADCYSTSRHSLLQVQAASVYNPDRVCAAVFTGPYGGQVSTWACDYGTATRWFGGGRVDGVGAIHNGSPQFIYGVASQDF